MGEKKIITTTTTITKKRTQMVAGGSGSSDSNATERTPLVSDSVVISTGPSTLGLETAYERRFPKPIIGVPADPEILDALRKENLYWNGACAIMHFLLLFPAPIYLLAIRHRWENDVPATILFGAGKEICRIFLLFAAPMFIVVGALGWRYLRPPTRLEVPAELPLTPWQWFELREGKADPKIIEAAVWWAEHPASLRQRAEFAVRSWLVWSVLLSLFSQTLLITGFEFGLRGIPAWPWAMIPFSLLGGAHYLSVATQFFVDRGLKSSPVEDRGMGDGIVIPGLDIEETLKRERKRFDPCGSFSEPWAYFLGEILIFLILL